MNELPVRHPGGTEGEPPEGRPEGEHHPGDAPPEGVVQVDVSSWRLVATLAAGGALAGLVIVLVFQWARPRIEAYQARILREAIEEVLAAPDRVETAFLVEGAFTLAPPATADTSALERVYLGFDGSGQPVAVAVVGSEAGFQDQIRLIFGFDPESAEVLGMRVLESKETPGLGDKIEKDSAFVAEFEETATPLAGVKPARASGADEEVVMITGATISSRAVIDIINHRLEALGPAIDELWRSARTAADASTDGGTGAER